MESDSQDTFSVLENTKKFNRKLFPIYKMLVGDMLFYYAISYLFLVQVKGLTTSQVLFADAFYPLFRFILQVPCTILIEKIGKRNSLILGNSMISVYLLIVLGLIDTSTFILANFFAAFGFVIKGMSESNLLFDSLEESEDKREIFSKIDGKSSSLYYYMDSLSSLCAGFLFVFNPYFPITISFILSLIGIGICYKFKEIPNNENVLENENSNLNTNTSFINQTKTYIINLMQAFKFISKSNRLKSLILFNAMLVGFISVSGTLSRNLFDYINVSAQTFGLVFALYGFIAGFSANRSHFIHKKYRNRSLSLLSISCTLSVLFAGFVVFLHLPEFLVYYLVFLMISIQYIIKGPFYTLIKQYLNSFSDSNMRIKIYSANSLIEAICRSLLGFMCAYISSKISIEYTHILLGGIFTILFILFLNNMKTKVGLKPEEYKKSDISFTEVI